MKNIITILTLAIITSTAAMATSVPCIELNHNNLEFFVSADYNMAQETFDFNTAEKISIVQVYTMDGTLKFQLPVMSDQLSINRNLFDKGDYKLGFVMEGETEITFTKVNIK